MTANLTPRQLRHAAEMLRDNMTEPGYTSAGAKQHISRELRREPTDVWDIIDGLNAIADETPQYETTIVVTATLKMNVAFNTADEAFEKIETRLNEVVGEGWNGPCPDISVEGFGVPKTTFRELGL